MRSSLPPSIASDNGLIPEHPFARLLGLRLESIAVPAAFLLEGLPGTTMLACGFAAVLLCVATRSWLPRRRESVRNDGDEDRLADRIVLCAFGCLLVLVGVILESPGLIVLGTMGLLASIRFSDVRLPGELLQRFRAILILLLAAMIAIRFIPLVPAEFYARAVQAMVRCISLVALQSQPGQFVDSVIIDGTRVHVSHFVCCWGLLPIAYAFMVVPEKVTTKLSRAAVALVANWLVYGFFVSYLVRNVQNALMFSAWAAIVDLCIGYTLSLFCWRVMPPVSARRSRSCFHWPVVLPLCLGASICAFAHHKDRQLEKVSFDESHGKWETAEGSFDTVNYGRDTVYNYRLMKEWIGSQWRVSFLRGELEADDGADTIIVKMPTTFFLCKREEVGRSVCEKRGHLACHWRSHEPVRLICNY